VLHHILRGNRNWPGFPGCQRSGRSRDSLQLIRPLLEVTRADVLSFLAARIRIVAWTRPMRMSR